MVDEIKKYANIDYFFFYGKNSLEEESAVDLVTLLLQPKRSLFYSRSDGAGVEAYENAPDALSLQVGLRFSIAQAVAMRNQRVTDGKNGYRDRRIAVSQWSINFQSDRQGDIDVTVLYFLYGNYTIPQNISLPVGRM